MKKILLTVLVWILPTVLWGKQLSDKQYIFQRIDVREGLSYQVNCMTVSTVQVMPGWGPKTVSDASTDMNKRNI